MHWIHNPLWAFQICLSFIWEHLRIFQTSFRSIPSFLCHRTHFPRYEIPVFSPDHPPSWIFGLHCWNDVPLTTARRISSPFFSKTYSYIWRAPAHPPSTKCNSWWHHQLELQLPVFNATQKLWPFQTFYVTPSESHSLFQTDFNSEMSKFSPERIFKNIFALSIPLFSFKSRINRPVFRKYSEKLSSWHYKLFS